MATGKAIQSSTTQPIMWSHGYDSALPLSASRGRRYEVGLAREGRSWSSELQSHVAGTGQCSRETRESRKRMATHPKPAHGLCCWLDPTSMGGCAKVLDGLKGAIHSLTPPAESETGGVQTCFRHHHTAGLESWLHPYPGHVFHVLSSHQGLDLAERVIGWSPCLLYQCL